MSGGASPQPRADQSPLAACRSCESLVETQYHDGQEVWPEFCPWCGRKTFSILGSEVDGYRIERMLAVGGFGFVFLASNIAQPSMLAVVKFLRPTWTYSDDEIVATFLEEARLTQEIGRSCWNVVNVLNVRESPWPHIMMEYIDGTTLDQVISHAGSERIPLEDVKGYLRGMAEALAATHKHHRVHRDLKPVNLMVIESAKVPEAHRKIKLLDFGLAMHTEFADSDDTADHRTETRIAARLVTAGTPEYMAPEAFDGGGGVSLDLYAFGVTAHEILTGRLPWAQAPPLTDRATYWRKTMRHGVPENLRVARPETPKWLARVVRDCLAKDPRARPQSAEELIRRLREPLPFWMKAAVALLVVGVGSLIFWLVSTRDVDVPVQWTVEGVAVDENTKEPFEGDLVVWRAGGDDLSAREFSLRVPGGKRIEHLHAGDDRVECAIEEGSLSARIRFLRDVPSHTELALTGSGQGFRFRTVLRVKDDAIPPVIGPLELERGGDERDGHKARAIRRDERLQPSGVVVVDVEEAQLRTVRLRLELEGSDRPPVLVKPFRRKPSGESRWTIAFELADIGDGRYRARVVATDYASNKVSGESTRLVVDETLNWQRGRAPLYARGRVLVPFQLDEPLTALEIRQDGSQVPLEVWKLGDDLEPLDLVRDLAPARVPVDELQPFTRYVLAYSPPEEPRVFAAELLLADTATPANRQRVLLRGEWPQPLTVRDGLSASMQLRSSSPERSEEGHVVEFRPLESENSLRTSLDIIESGFLEITEGRVTAASFRLGVDATVPLAVAKDQVRLPEVRLSPNAMNVLTLLLWGAGSRPYTVSFRVTCDTQAPRLLPVTTSPPPGTDQGTYYAVPDGSEIQLRVEADEELERVQLQHGAHVISWPDEAPRDRSVAVFSSLKELWLPDGNPHIKVTAWDRTGLSTETTVENLVLNSRAPRLNPNDKQKDGRFEIPRREYPFRFDARDENGIDWTRARCLLTYELPRTGETGERFLGVTRENPDDPTSLAEVLVSLPDGARGVLQPQVSDQLGLRSDDRWVFEVQLPAVRFRPEFVYEGIDWVYVDLGADQRYYISKYEITNATYSRLAGRVPGRVERPRYWQEDGAFPVFVANDGRQVPGDDFPVVGVLPRDAEAVAAVVAARLPRWEEWLSIARRDNPGGSYPWREVDGGGAFVNYFRAWENSQSAFAADYYVQMRVGERTYDGVALSPATANPFPPALRGYTFGRIPHLLGNVGEIVRYEDGFAVAGRGFDTVYEDMKLTAGPVRFADERMYSQYRVGLRWVVPLAEADDSFLRKAREP